MNGEPTYDPVILAASKEANDLWAELFDYYVTWRLNQSGKNAAYRLDALRLNNRLRELPDQELADMFHKVSQLHNWQLIRAFKLGLMLGRRYADAKDALLRNKPKSPLASLPSLQLTPDDDPPEGE